MNKKQKHKGDIALTALTSEKKMPIPVYTRIFSAKEEGIVSEDEETLKALKFLSGHFSKNNIRAFDRGYDNNRYYADILKCYTFTEILTIPKAEDSAIHPEILGIGSIKLTKKQHVAHINNIISLLKANENYDVVLSDTPIQNIIVLAKENVGVMMINTKPPYCTFAFNEQNMVGEFWDYLSSIKKKTQSRNKTIEDLEKFISFAD